MSPSKFLKNRAKDNPPKRPAGKPPLSERNYWREEHRIQARHIKAGDALIVKSGRTRRFLHICELGRDKLGVEVVCNDNKEPGGVLRKGFALKEMVEIRRTYHD